MSAKTAKPAPAKTVVAAPRKITLDDVRRKAEHVQQTATDDVKHVAKQVTSLDQTRMILYMAAGVAVVAGVAYYMGTRAARAALPAPPA